MVQPFSCSPSRSPIAKVGHLLYACFTLNLFSLNISRCRVEGSHPSIPNLVCLSNPKLNILICIACTAEIKILLIYTW